MLTISPKWLKYENFNLFKSHDYKLLLIFYLIYPYYVLILQRV